MILQKIKHATEIIPSFRYNSPKRGDFIPNNGDQIGNKF